MNRESLWLPLLIVGLALLDLLAFTVIEHRGLQSRLAPGQAAPSSLPFCALMFGQLALAALWATLSDVAWRKRYPPLVGLFAAFLLMPEPGFSREWPILAMQVLMAGAAGWLFYQLGLRWRVVGSEEPSAPRESFTWQVSLSQLLVGIAILAGFLEISRRLHLLEQSGVVATVTQGAYFTCLAVLASWAALGPSQQLATHGVLLAILGAHACLTCFLDAIAPESAILALLYACGLLGPLWIIRQRGYRLTAAAV